jgi:hypothetical protein
MQNPSDATKNNLKQENLKLRKHTCDASAQTPRPRLYAYDVVKE